MEKAKMKETFSRVKSMLKLDFYRLLHTPAFYITLLISALIPALLLTTSGMPTVDQYGNEQPPAIVYTNVWQLVESLGGSAVAENPMDFSGFANINMVYIFAGVLTSIFVAHDYSSGFVKNIFTVHSKKGDYVLSKTITSTVSGIGLLAAYVIGAVVSGLIMSKSFSVDVGGLIACLVSKAFLMAIFSSLFLAVSVFFRSKLWLTIICTFLFGMMLYPAASVATLSADLLTVVLTLLAGAAGAVFSGWISTRILHKRDLV